MAFAWLVYGSGWKEVAQTKLGTASQIPAAIGSTVPVQKIFESEVDGVQKHSTVRYAGPSSSDREKAKRAYLSDSATFHSGRVA